MQQDLLERELRARQQYWHHQEQEEQWLVELLGYLSQVLGFTPGNDTSLQVRPRGATSCPTHLPRPHRFLFASLKSLSLC